MSRRMQRMVAERPSLHVVALVLVLAFAGCGDEDGAGGSAALPTTVAAASEGAAPTDGSTGEVSPPVPGADADAEADGSTVEAQVFAAFERYRQALIDRDGDEAVTLASVGTVEWYDTLLVLARQAGPADLLERAPLGDAITVVAMRANLGDDLLEVSTGTELFVRGVDDGLVGDDVASLQFSEIVEGGAGDAFGVLNGLEVARFVREGGEWRFDMVYTIETNFMADNEVEVLAALTGVNGSSRLDLFELLAAAYGSTWEELSQPVL